MTDVITSGSRFSATAGKCAVAGVAGAVLNFLAPGAPISLIVNVVCLWLMYSQARALALDETQNFEPLIASETMVTFGILSLVLGLASIICRLLLGMFDFSSVQNGNFEGLLDFLPFVEGLLTAGFAPFLAVLLRIAIAEAQEDVDPTGDLTDLAKATASLTRTMNAANSAMDAFRNGTVAAGASTAGLATAIKAESDKWGSALEDGQAQVKSFADATKSSRSEIAGLAAETERLRSATTEAATMLEELSRLIEAVERFVAPREPA